MPEHTKQISARFAMSLEYALGIPKSFWLNLQANYDAELLEANEEQTITEEEKVAREELKDVVKHLRQIGIMPARESKNKSILSLRKVLQISNIANLRGTCTGLYCSKKRWYLSNGLNHSRQFRRYLLVFFIP